MAQLDGGGEWKLGAGAFGEVSSVLCRTPATTDVNSTQQLVPGRLGLQHTNSQAYILRAAASSVGRDCTCAWPCTSSCNPRKAAWQAAQQHSTATSSTATGAAAQHGNTQPGVKLTAPCHAALTRAEPGPATLTRVAAVLQVYKALLRGVNPVAVKVLRDHSYTSRDEFGREVGLLKTLHNSNIVQFQVRTCYSRSSTQLAASAGAHCRPAGTSCVCLVRRCPARLASHIPGQLCRAHVSSRTRCCSSRSSWMVGACRCMAHLPSLHCALSSCAALSCLHVAVVGCTLLLQ